MKSQNNRKKKCRNSTKGPKERNRSQAKPKNTTGNESFLNTWTIDGEEYCKCPGEHLHTKETKPNHCKVFVNERKEAGGTYCQINCVHSSCSELVAKTNSELCSGTSVSVKNPHIIGSEPKENDPLVLRSRAARATLLNRPDHFTLKNLKDKSPTKIPESPTKQYRLFLDLFDDGDVLWVGDRYDSKPNNLKVKSEWQKLEPSYPLICGAVFEPNAQARQNGFVKDHRYFVLECDDVLVNLDQQARIISYFSEIMKLRAVVFSGNKSLHGYFDHPGEEALKQLKSIMMGFQLDTSLLTKSQPSRLPGYVRDGNLQRLHYLDLIDRDKQHTVNPKQLIEHILPPPVYYLAHAKKFYRPNPNGHYIESTVLNTYLERNGYTKGDDIKACMMRIEDENQVDFVGRLGGHKPGLYKSRGTVVLVPSSTPLILPKEGETPVWDKVINSLFGHDARHIDRIYAWLQEALRGVHDGVKSQHPILVIVGPAGCGKTLFANTARHLFGQGFMDPIANLTRADEFNKELASSSLVIIDDTKIKMKPEVKTAYDDAIKGIVTKSGLSVRYMYQERITLSPIQFGMIITNTTKECLSAIPLLSEDNRDKFLILSALDSLGIHELEVQFDREIHPALEAEAEAIVYKILNYSVPKEIRGQRYFVAPYISPYVERLLNDIDPRQAVYELCETACRFAIGNFKRIDPKTGQACLQFNQAGLEVEFQKADSNRLKTCKIHAKASQILTLVRNAIPDFDRKYPDFNSDQKFGNRLMQFVEKENAKDRPLISVMESNGTKRYTIHMDQLVDQSAEEDQA